MLSDRKQREAVLLAAEDSLTLLREDPKRCKSLLRSIAALVEEVSVVLSDAGHDDQSGRVRLLSKTLRGAALLPAVASTAIARKLVRKALA